ncbi:MAG: class IIb bacteriocin, lactobin A/cerein 7B family [Prolixibacteraceae bacterium]|jgi:lactobin A/cerein 7B family class IIb bacteriocin|nr:class IIb bacteriocin, lactobin A/cerein 7B family [Prolixibacteraceae bacterium]
MKELNRVELAEINGGVVWFVAIAIGVAIGGICGILSDWDNLERGIKGEPYQKN